MTYQVLARKWRPRSFREMAGQGHVLKTLVNALDNNRLHHAYLFTGTRGVGKTTIARILAKCLNCETGVSSEPCGTCSACREIDEGRFIDLIEVDAASRTKVEDTRELLDNVQYAPSRGRFKVYLIDEVHMLSGHSFNALLKTLEEPPPHVKFLLATTDPQKLPVTVLSRCLQFNLKNLSPEQLVQHLRHILQQEAIPFEDPALWQLGHAAQGSVRDSLTLLDQAIGYCGGTVTESEVGALLGTIDRGIIHKLVDALIAGDAAGLLAVVEAAADHAPDFALVLGDLLSYLHRVAVAQVVPGGIDNSQGDRDMVLAHARALPPEDIQLFYQIALKGRADLPLAVDPRAGLEMTLLRMLAFTPQPAAVSPAGEEPQGSQGQGEADADRSKKKRAEILVDESLTPSPGQHSSPGFRAEARPGARPDSLSSSHAVRSVSSSPAARAGAADPAASTSPPGSRGDEAPSPGHAAAPPSAFSPAAVDVVLAGDSLPARGRASPAAAVPLPEARPEQAAPGKLEKAPVRPQLKLEDVAPERWIGLFHALDLRGITKSIAANCVLKSADGARVALVLDESQASVYNDEHRKRIRDALAAYFGTEVELTVESGPITMETPALWRRRKEAERQQEAEEAFRGDPVVQEIVERFSGTIQLDSIEPLSPKNF